MILTMIELLAIIIGASLIIGGVLSDRRARERDDKLGQVMARQMSMYGLGLIVLSRVM